MSGSTVPTMSENNYITISADEVNCLIYAYFRDSGFKHSSFALLAEAKLDHSPHFSKHIRRGELVELLSKALLYIEVETHLEADGLASGCKSGFTLLEPHQCTAEPKTIIPLPTPPPLKSNPPPDKPPAKTATTSNTGKDTGGKRKATPPPPEETRSEKRQKTATATAKPTAAPPPVAPEPEKSKPPTEAKTSVTASKTRKPKMLKDDYLVHPAVHLLRGHKAEVFVCQWNPVYFDVLATGAKDATAIIWDIPTSEPTGGRPPIIRDKLSAFKAADLTAVNWSPDGALLATACFDNYLRVFDRSGNLYYESNKHKGAIYAVRFDETGDFMISASLDNTVGLWNMKEKHMKYQYKNHKDCCIDVEWLNANYIASCGMDKTIYICNTRGTTSGMFTGHTAAINQVRRSPSGTRLASCADDNTARVWNITEYVGAISQLPIKKRTDCIILAGHTRPVSSLVWAQKTGPDKHEILATSSFDGKAMLWDATAGTCLRRFTDHKKPVYGLAFSPDARFVVTGGGDGYLHLYEALPSASNTSTADGSSLSTKQEHTSPVWSWFAGTVKSGVFEIDWQQTPDGRSRLAVALERRDLCVVDANKIPELQI